MTIAPALHTDAYAPQSGDASFDVESYDLTLDYRVRTNRLTGTAVINAVALAPTRTLRLDLIGLRASRVRLDGDKRTRFRQGARTLTVTAPAPIEAGERFSIEVEYAGAPQPRNSRWGRIGWEELDDGALVASQPTGAPTWFPCNDRPDNRALYRVTITTDAEYAVAATGVVMSHRIARGRVTISFASEVPTATYLAAVYIARLRPIEFAVPTGVPGVLVRPPAIAHAVDRAFAEVPRILEVFSERFGPYPQEKITIVVVPDELEIPLEAQGMAVFGANHLDEASHRLIPHEIAHQWFGNSVGIAQWSDIWLNEGFACYAEWVWAEAAGGPSADQSARAHYAGLARLPQNLVIAEPGPDLMFDDRVYKRGALAVHALRRLLGDEAFFDLVRAWTSTHRHSLVHTEDFRMLVADRGGPRAADLLSAWIDQAPLPKL